MQVFLGVAIGGGLVAVLAALMHDFPDIPLAGRLPEWTQAFGTIIAVFGTGLIAVWQDRRKTLRASEERRIQSAALAMTIYPCLIELRASTRTVRKLLAIALETNPDGTVGEYKDTIDIDLLRLQIDSLLTENLPNLHLLGWPCLQLIVGAMRYNKSVDGVMHGMGYKFTALDRFLTLVERPIDIAIRDAATFYDRGLSAPKA